MSHMTKAVGTLTYCSPEKAAGKQYGTKSDVYSLGIILFEMYRIFQTKMERATALCNLKNGTFPADMLRSFPQECQLIRWMLDHDVDKRPSCVELLAHPALQQYTSPFDIQTPSGGSPTRIPLDECDNCVKRDTYITRLINECQRRNNQVDKLANELMNAKALIAKLQAEMHAKNMQADVNLGTT